MRSTVQHACGLAHARNPTLRNLFVIIVRDLSSIHQIGNTEIRELVQQRIDDLGGEAFDVAYFLIVESGDSVEALSAQMGFPVLCNRYTGIRYDQAGFTPSFEFVEEFPGCFDVVFVLSDDGFGVELFIPKAEGIDPDLLAMCQTYSVRSDA